jgi:hypothetical protein
MYRILFVLFVAFLTDAAAQTVPPECQRTLSAIGSQRAKIDEARRVLTLDEVDCAFLEFQFGPADRCAPIKATAMRNPEKNRVWAEAIIAWQSFDQMRLQLRGIEDRLNITCSAP